MYALTIVGSTDDTLGNVVKAVSLTEAHSAYAAAVRKKLDESRDAGLLGAAGSYLVQNASNANVDFDHVALGKTYLERAAQLDPSIRAHEILASLGWRERHQRWWQALRSKELDLAGGEIARKGRAGERLTRDEEKKLKDLESQAVSTLSEADRFAYLPELAANSYMYAEGIDTPANDAAGAKARWDRSKQYARDLLALAPKFKDDPRYGDAIYEANVALGANALREGDVKTAVRFMGEAARAPMLSGDLQYIGSLDSRLVTYLLKAGERASVADFLERAAQINAPRKEQMVKDAAAIRADQMPMSYQYMVTPH